MTRARRPYTLSLLLLGTLLLAGNTSQAALIQFVDAPPSGGSGTDYRIESITDLDVGGTSYDVTFHHGVSFDSLTDPITFGTLASATSALDDIVSFINGEAVNASLATIFTGNIVIPYDPTVGYVYESLSGLAPLSYTDIDLSGTVFPANPLFPNEAYVTFAVAPHAVPQPSALLMGVIAVLAGSVWCCFGHRGKRDSG